MLPPIKTKYLKESYITLQNLFIAVAALTFLHAPTLYANNGGSYPASSDNQSQQIIKQVVAAYGGKKLTQLKSLQLTDEYKAFRDGQSYRPDAIDMIDNLYTLTLDFKNQKNNFQWRRGTDKEFSIQHQQFNGVKGLRYYHNGKTFTENNNITFVNADRRHQLLLDTNLAHLLKSSQTKVQYLGRENLRGELHSKVKFNADNHPEMTLYIDDKTGLITQMQTPHWREGQNDIYNYSNPSAKQGITYAQGFYVTRGGNPFLAGVNRKIQFNIDTNNTFVAPENYQAQPAAMDFSAMSIKKVAKNLYLAGQNWGYSIFYNAGDYFVAAGGYKDISKRFDALKDYIKSSKPLKYMVVSHHHADHIGGVKEAEKMGAVFVTVQNNVDIINQRIGKILPNNRFYIVNEQGDFAGGQVQVIDYPSGHANHNLITYIKSAKLVFSADTYYSRQESGTPDGNKTLIKFKNKLADSGANVKYLAAAHSNLVLSYQDLLQSLQSISPPTVCPSHWEICAP